MNKIETESEGEETVYFGLVSKSGKNDRWDNKNKQKTDWDYNW